MSGKGSHERFTLMIQRRFETQNAFIQAFDDSADYGWDLAYNINQEGSTI